MTQVTVTLSKEAHVNVCIYRIDHEDQKTKALAINSMLENWNAMRYETIIMEHFEEVPEKEIKEGVPVYQINGKWYFPVYGCDTMQNILDDLYSEYLGVDFKPKIKEQD